MNKYIYEITNTITNQKYIGIRECECEPINDKYKGENTIVSKDFRKYGKKNFHKRILGLILSTKNEEALLEIYKSEGKYVFLEEGAQNNIPRTRSDKGGKSSSAIKVICLNNGDILESMAEAAEKYGTVRSAISQACDPDNSLVKYAGRDKNGEKLMWDYYDAYLAKLDGKDYDYSANKRDGENKNKVRVRCIETGEEFDSMTDAAKRYNINHGGISTSCTSPLNSVGTFIKETSELLHWEYVNKEDNKYYDEKYADRF